MFFGPQERILVFTVRDLKKFWNHCFREWDPLRPLGWKSFSKFSLLYEGSSNYKLELSVIDQNISTVFICLFDDDKIFFLESIR